MSHDWNPTDLRAQERDREEKDLDRQIAREAEDRDLIWLMSETVGRRFVWRMLEYAGVFRSSFSLNSMQTSFNEGNRNYGLRLMDQINRVCPELYTEMVKEAQNVRNDDGNADHSN